MKKIRYLSGVISEILPKKMVFIGGPRQVGKTTLALEYLSPSSSKNPQYLNWDRASDQRLILDDELPLSGSILVLDEIHKYKLWRNLTKGLFDKYHEDLKIIVTGSARLDHFRKGGDSLLGRYRYFRLHPFSINELKLEKSAVEDLLNYGGFPEPFLSKNRSEHKLWLRERVFRLVNDDVRDLSTIKDISQISMLIRLLPSRVGSLLSLKSLAEDISVSQPSVDRWLLTLEQMYYCYRIAPYGSPKVRATKKLQKLYLWDWSEVEGIGGSSPLGARFENFVAGHLLKYCHYLEDTKGEDMELRYLRDADGREIDFVVLKNRKPIFAVECKSGDRGISPHIKYFQERTSIPEFYQVHLGTKSFGHPKTGMVLNFQSFCQKLGLP